MKMCKHVCVSIRLNINLVLSLVAFFHLIVYSCLFGSVLIQESSLTFLLAFFSLLCSSFHCVFIMKKVSVILMRTLTESVRLLNLNFFFIYLRFVNVFFHSALLIYNENFEENDDKAHNGINKSCKSTQTQTLLCDIDKIWMRKWGRRMSSRRRSVEHEMSFGTKWRLWSGVTIKPIIQWLIIDEKFNEK